MNNALQKKCAIRFRRWSRKAYAAFASIGKCVTIGCLRKNVADSSLSKQKATGNGHTKCGKKSIRKEDMNVVGYEIDYDISPKNNIVSTCYLTALNKNLRFSFGTQAICLYIQADKQEREILKYKNNKRYGLTKIMLPVDKRHNSFSPYLFLYQRS